MVKRNACSDSDAVTDLSRQVLAVYRLNPLIGPHTRHFWEIQEQILNEAEAFSRHWFARRHIAARTALKASEEVAGFGGADPEEMMTALNAWQHHSAERIAEDMREWAGFCLRCAGHLASGEAAAGREALEKTSLEIAMVTAKHADPV
ncbi:hypothetical protein QKW60_16945 [Defluviimonas aestuarii]|uniref:hypothetical protein n=1 Tax=Albidovulum aestuarii TaxID=1130726 RepID=UPI00249A7D08|nr:hypothetical protein [Defluviimonas aestuarii]MDI3338098.1 hypothetical protein [Defluviimonas aestuarii]